MSGQLPMIYMHDPAGIQTCITDMNLNRLSRQKESKSIKHHIGEILRGLRCVAAVKLPRILYASH